MKELLAALTLILVVLISGCKKSDYVATVGVCPIVISTIPANGAVAVPLNQVVSATFNEKMNATTITSSTFTVIDATKSAGLKAAVVVTGTLTYSGMTSFFTPSSPLSPNTTYTGRMTTAARDLTGNALQADYVWTFTTDLPPTVTSDPANNATDVLLNKVIVATFSVPMDSLTIKTPATNFTIKQGTTLVPGKFSYSSDGKTASFTPTSNLAPFTVYNGFIAAGVKNKLGTSMAADYYPWSFTTIPQLTLSSLPALGGTTSGAGLFAVGSSVTVIAIANAGFTFFNWTDGATVASTSATYQLTMPAGNKTLVANFTPRYIVTVLSNPILGGVTGGGGTFNSGTSVTVTAVPNAGFTFTNWTDGVNIVSTAANYQFTLTANRTLVANYAAIPYTVAVSSNPLLGGTTTGGGTYNSGAPVTVTAIPNVGFTFTNWTEGVNIVSSSAIYLFTIAGNRTLVANYTAIPFTVVVSSNPLLGGITTGGGTFISGAPVTVNAVPNTGFTFTNWTEGLNIVSTDASYLFTIAGNRVLVANYNAIPYTVAVSSNPLLGGTTSGGGIFNSGSLVTVNAVPNVGYRFTNWTEGLVVASTVANYQFTITGNRILVANYTPITYTVAVSSNPLIGGTTSGGGTFNSRATVLVVAAANTGYTFTNWKEGVNIVSTLANYSFTLTGDRILVANYTINTYTLNVTANNGTVAKDPPLGPYNYGTTVKLTPTPDPGYTFTSWSVDALGSDNPLIVTMNANKNITANFTAIPPLFTSDFGAFGGNAGITNQGIYTVINNGSIGTTGVSTKITGFHDSTGDSYTETPLKIGDVKGRIYTDAPPPVIFEAGGPYGGNAETMAIAQAGLLAARNFYNSISPASRPGGITLDNDELGGRVLAPGTYVSGSTYKITNLDLTLNGDANAVWVFQVPTALTVGADSGARSVLLTGGAQAKNVYWYVGTSAVINYGGGGTMVGTIIAGTEAITLSSPDNSTNTTVQTVLNGRAIALVAGVTMVNTIINVPLP